jgi:hypothetical protein
MSQCELMKARAERLIRQQVEQVAVSQCPAPDLCDGMIQMAYAAGLITDTGLGYWQRTLDLAVDKRRRELCAERHRRTIGAPA